MDSDLVKDPLSRITRSMHERRLFLDRQRKWLDATLRLVSELEEATQNEEFQGLRAASTSVARKLPNMSEQVETLASAAERLIGELHASESEARQLRQRIAELAGEVRVTLDARQEKKCVEVLRLREREIAAELVALEQRYAKWDRIWRLLPGWLITWLFGGLRDQLHNELARMQSLLDAVPRLTDRLIEWRRVDTQCESLGKDLVRHRAQFRVLSKTLRKTASEVSRRGVQEDTDTVRAMLRELPPFLDPEWIPERWLDWHAENAALCPYIAIGSLTETQNEILEAHQRLRFPLLAPLIGSGHHLLIRCSSESQERARSLFLSLVLRTALLAPHRSRHLLLDPKSQGRAFPFARQLPDVDCRTLRLHDALEERVADISRINQTYLDDRLSSFEQLSDTARMHEKLEFIFVASFPTEYDRRSIELLQRISANGPVAGKYLVIEHRTDVPLPHGLSLEEFANLNVIEPARPPLPQVETSGLDAAVDAVPDSDFIRRVANSLAQRKPPDTSIRWDEAIESSPTKWWLNDATDRIETSVGRTSASRELRIWFGINEDRRPCAHGMLAAMTGAGKSNLYHVLICGLAARYGPEELRLYLIDGKDGVEFQPYAALPHCAAVSLNTSPELARGIVTELLAEKERRNSLFAAEGVPDIASFRRKQGERAVHLPRILLLADEYQELFEDDRDSQASGQLLQLAQQGRSVGIHMLLGSQRFGVIGLLQQTAVFGNIHLRIAMKMAEADIAALTEFTAAGKRMIRNCDLPGKIVVNDHSGDDRANQAGRVALLSRDKIHELVATMRDKAARTAERYPLAAVFNGKSQPLFTENPQFARVLRSPHRLKAEEWEAFAREPLRAHGLAEAEWYPAERPFVMWLGQQLNLYGHAKVVLRRQPLDNVLVVGGNPSARYGMLGSMLASLSCSSDDECPTLIRVVDRTPPGAPYSGALKACCEVLAGLGLDTKYAEDGAGLAEIISELTTELSRRFSLNESARAAAPPAVLVIGDCGRFQDLKKQHGRFSGLVEDSELGKALRRLCADGPTNGLHVCLGFAAFLSMLEVLDRHQVEAFRHRVALQMSEEDSFTYARSRSASQLQVGGMTPILALYADVARGIQVRFKPYTVETSEAWRQMLDGLQRSVRRWRE